MKNSSFIALSTPYYSFDPRAKIIFTLLMCILPFLPLSWLAQCILTLIALLISFTQIGGKNTMKNIKVILPIIILMTLLMPLQGRGGEALWSIKGRVIISVGSVISWQRILNRFLLLSLMCSLLIETTKSSSILLALRCFRLPYSVALVLSLSLRLIPTISDTFLEIRDSQRLRLPNPGEEEAKKKKITSLLPTLTSVLVVSIKSIASTSEALELRGYGRNNKRTLYRSLKSVKKVFPHFVISVIVPAIIGISLLYWR